MDAIVLTGGLAYGKEFVEMILSNVLIGLQMSSFIQEKMNLQALAEGALRVLRGEEDSKRIIRYEFKTAKI